MSTRNSGIVEYWAPSTVAVHVELHAAVAARNTVPPTRATSMSRGLASECIPMSAMAAAVPRTTWATATAADGRQAPMSASQGLASPVDMRWNTPSSRLVTKMIVRL